MEHDCCDHASSEEPKTFDAADLNADFTCPMHPEVHQLGPGPCPLCGMALEPSQVSAGSAAAGDEELRDMSRRFWLALVITAPVFAYSMLAMMPGFELLQMLPARFTLMLQLLLTTLVVFGAGWPLLARCYFSFKNRHLNMFSLIGIGVLAAYFYSAAILFWPSIFSDTNHESYFESAAVIVTLSLLGQVLELRARAKTSAALKGLLSLAPDKAMLVMRDGPDRETKTSLIQVHDLIRVRPGERIAVDGVVTEGEGLVDEAILTGEALPVNKAPGAELRAGTINIQGSFIFEARQIGGDTLLNQIVRMASAAQRTRAPIQRLADRAASYFVPAVLIAAIITFFAWYFLGPEPRVTLALVSAVSVLIIACPCALGLATPMSIMVASGRGAQSGILFRDARALETLRSVSLVVLDKTGTLTEGRPEVIEVEYFNGFQAHEALAFAANLEKSSEHLFAAAVISYATSQQASVDRSVKDFQNHAGQGASGLVDGRHIVIGNERLLEAYGIQFAEESASITESKIDFPVTRGSRVFLAVDGRPAALFYLADRIKVSSQRAVTQLKKVNLRTVIATGDTVRAAQEVARAVGITEVHAGLLPQNKVELIQRYQAQGLKVAMVGDGINDAPALAVADVGIAMGKGIDVTVENADITLMSNDLESIGEAFNLSRATVTNIKQNLFFAFAYNMVGVPIAAGALYPYFGFRLSPVVASIAMSLSSFSVITNSLRLRRRSSR